MKLVSEDHMHTVIATLARFVCDHERPLPCEDCLMGSATAVEQFMQKNEMGLISELQKPADTFESFLRNALQRSGIDVEVLEGALTEARADDKPRRPAPRKRGRDGRPNTR